jgi:hypothetical protein
VLGGCARARAPQTGPGKLQGSAQPAPTATLDPDLVNAVSSANSTTPISMKFRIASHPLVGRPLTIEVALIPAQGVEFQHIHTSFQVGDGLQLSSERAYDVEQPAAGIPLEQELTVLPQQSGVLQINAIVTVDSDSGSISRTYSIPIIADAQPAA